MFSNQLETLMRDDFMGNVPVAGFLDELGAMMKHEFFAEIDPETRAFPDPLYKPLVGKDEIRLLRLEPGTSGGLKGDLLRVHLDKNPAYEALSYAWGPPVKTYEITLPNGILRITESLFRGLMRLRRRGKSRLLWIDQLCINQDDNVEKIQQILLMQRIYSSASRVLAWLGEDEGNGSIALRLLEQTGKTDTSSLQRISVSAAWMKENGFPAAGHRDWFALLHFWRRPWFRRAWVVQEFVLAKDVLMICGKAQLSWEAFTSAHEKMTQYSLLDWGTYGHFDIQEEKDQALSGSFSLRFMIEIKHSTKLGSLYANAVRSFSERDETALEELNIGSWGKRPGVKELVMQLREIPEATGPVTQMLGQLIETLTPEVEKIRLPLCHLLIMFGKSEATHPRDRLFAFLGLAADGDALSLRPNYDEPIESVFLRYARYFIETGDGIRLLYQSSGILNKEISIPSWVPDWTQSEKRPLNQIAIHGLFYKAAANTSPQIRCANDEKEIVISGVHVDTVSRTAIYNPGDPFDSDDWFLNLQNIFTEVDSFILNRESYVTGEPLFDVLWKTLIGNASADTGFAAPEEYGQQYHVCRKIIEDIKQEGLFPRLEDTNSYFKRLFSMIDMYTLCETRTGLVGMVPLDTVVGDSVYIFAGSGLPFILRPNAELQNKYEVVGGCYIHGVMNGELVGSDKWREEDVTLL